MELAYGARTIVWRLDGAVDVSDSEMLSKVPSLRKLDFRSRPGARSVLLPVSPS